LGREFGDWTRGYMAIVSLLAKVSANYACFLGGYRVYFGEDAGNIVILLCGGDKSTQPQDIQTAQAYWKEYQSHG